MKAVILAGGLGTRLSEETTVKPKPMVEVGGKTLIDHMLDRLAEAGIRRAVVNVHAHADHLEAHLNARTTGPDIIISDERDQLLETGGGMVKALPLLGVGPVLVCNIDAIWTEANASEMEGLLGRFNFAYENEPRPTWVASEIKKLISQWDPERMEELLLLAPADRTLGYYGKGDFLFQHDGRLDWRGDRESAPYVYAGVEITKLDRLAREPLEPFSRKRIWDHTVAAGTAYGHTLDGFWMHVGDPEARDEAEAILAK